MNADLGFHQNSCFFHSSGLGRLSVSISMLLRFLWCEYELLGWSGARVMKVFIFFLLVELLKPREAIGGTPPSMPCRGKISQDF